MSTDFDAKRNLNVGEVRDSASSLRAHVAILPEDDGTFSAIVLNLPGAGSCGDTLDEAVANVKDAVLAVVESYQDDGISVPWTAEYEIPDGATCMWIEVNG